MVPPQLMAMQKRLAQGSGNLLGVGLKRSWKGSEPASHLSEWFPALLSSFCEQCGFICSPVTPEHHLPKLSWLPVVCFLSLMGKRGGHTVPCIQ